MERTTVSKYLLITIVMGMLIAASVTIILWKNRYHKSRWTQATVAQVQSDLKQHIPIGSSREQVAAYLDAQKIPHRFYGGDLYQNTAYYNCDVALMSDTASSGLITTDIQIIFKFNPAMKLVSYTVREINKGP